MPSNNRVTLKAHEISHLKLRKGNSKAYFRPISGRRKYTSKYKLTGKWLKHYEDNIR